MVWGSLFRTHSPTESSRRGRGPYPHPVPTRFDSFHPPHQQEQKKKNGDGVGGVMNRPTNNSVFAYSDTLNGR